MGLSASQSRLLSLTTRLSALELKAQQISNDKIRLSTNTSEVSQAYADALSKEKLTIASGYDSSTGATTYSDMTYSNLTGDDNTAITAQYGLSDGNGNLVVTEDIAEKYETYNTYFSNAIESAEETYVQAQQNAETTKKEYDDAKTALSNYNIANGQTDEWKNLSANVTSTSAAYEAAKSA